MERVGQWIRPHVGAPPYLVYVDPDKRERFPPYRRYKYDSRWAMRGLGSTGATGPVRSRDAPGAMGRPEYDAEIAKRRYYGLLPDGRRPFLWSWCQWCSKPVLTSIRTNWKPQAMHHRAVCGRRPRHGHKRPDAMSWVWSWLEAQDLRGESVEGFEDMCIDQAVPDQGSYSSRKSGINQEFQIG